MLLGYDQEITAVTRRLNEKRITHGEPPIGWKYFQYLALLFTEIYLDRYFQDPGHLRAALNQHIETFNGHVDDADQVAPFDPAADIRIQLNKLAFWMATGSGKTLLMHAHILQYRRYVQTHGRARELNRIILLTPNEGLSQQHLREFEKSGIEAEIFNKDGRGLFAGQAVEILEVTKLKEEMGEKTIAVEAFEGNNLVLVDEGHRGASAGQGGTWMKHRNALCEQGFSFEYSATFGQAVKSNQELTNLYARSVLFDYSYSWFYGDGFGKDYQILNLEDDTDAEWMQTYLTACLLAFYQQQRLYREQGAAVRPFNLERPLWIFVGGSVTAALTARDASDIVQILRFVAGYVSDRAASIRRIKKVLHEDLVTASGKNLFAGRFAYLNTSGLSPEQVFEETLNTTFNAPGGGMLYVENLKGVVGEIALRLGDNDPFGVINVGDDNKLIKRCEENGLNTGEREFGGSLFHELDKPDSAIHLLIGSKKFTEGWNSWRVSTMGLMNVGRGEGAQIIQLFGRGVRLKGYGMSLKRSNRAPLPADLERPRHIDTLETLSIFGIRADYMAQFRDFLEEKGLPAKEKRVEFILPIIKNLGKRPLKTIRLKKRINGVNTEFGDAFRMLGPIPTVRPPAPSVDPATEWLQRNPVVLNWYPKIQAMKSIGLMGGDTEEAPYEASLSPQHRALLNLDRLYFELERFKAERGWYNLNLTRAGIDGLLADTTWYRLLIPEHELAFDSFEKLRRWQEIALALLKKYTERFYGFHKREWELPHLEYQDLTEDDPNFYVVKEDGAEYGYSILIEESQREIVNKLEELKQAIERGDLKRWEFRGLKAIFFDRHLYHPLIFAEGGAVEITPVPLNKGERRFVENLKSFCDRKPTVLEGKELYLLRNLSKGRGVGFFEAGNFHPDFILWILTGRQQQVVFIDPKGIRHIGKDDPKVRFYETIKEIEERLENPNIILHVFLVSNTPSHEMSKLWGLDKAEMQRRHILFAEEDNDRYVQQIIDMVIAGRSRRS